MYKLMEIQTKILPKGAKLFFAGIGGVGMSALAKFYAQNGYPVAGYDRTESAITIDLIQNGIPVFYIDEPNLLDDFTHFIYTPAIKEDTHLFNESLRRQMPRLKRAEALGAIVNHKTLLAVAGTHGKTTTTAMLTHLLVTAGAKPTAFIGGLAKNFGSTYVAGDSDLVVVEADEFDRSFLHLTPNHLVVTALDPDHLDIYQSPEAMRAAYLQLIHQIKPNGCLYPNQKLLNFLPDTLPYRQSPYGDVNYQNLRHAGITTVFDFVSEKDRIPNLSLSMPGIHNVENMCAAIRVCLELGIETAVLTKGVETFQGIQRRYDIRLHTPNLTIIDDYAHHPVEVSAAIQTTRNLFPTHKIIVAFQPHLYSRTKDFYIEFANALSLADAIFLIHIYPAREKPIVGITSKIIYDELSPLIPSYLINLETFVEALQPELVVPTALLILGAGNIDSTIPGLVEHYRSFYKN